MLSTHIMQEVEAVCSRVIIINRVLLLPMMIPRVMLQSTDSRQDVLIELLGGGERPRIRCHS